MQLFYSSYLVLELYMFRTPFAPVIRSTINCKENKKAESRWYLYD